MNLSGRHGSGKLLQIAPFKSAGTPVQTSARRASRMKWLLLVRGPVPSFHQRKRPSAYDGEARTNRARSSRNISNGLMHFTPTPMHAFGILIFLVEAAATS